MPCSTWTTRSPSFRSRNAAANAFSSFVRRAFLRTRRPKISSSATTASPASPSTKPCEISPVNRCAWMAGSKIARGSWGVPACARTAWRRSSRSRRSRSAVEGEPQATTAATPRRRQSSSRRVSGASAPSSPWAASISPRMAWVSPNEKRIGSAVPSHTP